MKTISHVHFDSILEQTSLKPRFKKGLKFVTSVSEIHTNWSNLEYVAISDRTKNNGVLLLEPNNQLYIVQYELSRRIIDSKTGRDRAIICDFCFTWQPGSNAASIAFVNEATKHTLRFLCCGDLACSNHVRSLTKASTTSRAQLREDLTDEDRIARLKVNLERKIHQLQLTPIYITS